MNNDIQTAKEMNTAYNIEIADMQTQLDALSMHDAGPSMYSKGTQTKTNSDRKKMSEYKSTIKKLKNSVFEAVKQNRQLRVDIAKLRSATKLIAKQKESERDCPAEHPKSRSQSRLAVGDVVSGKRKTKRQRRKQSTSPSPSPAPSCSDLISKRREVVGKEEAQRTRTTIRKAAHLQQLSAGKRSADFQRHTLTQRDKSRRVTRTRHKSKSFDLPMIAKTKRSRKKHSDSRGLRQQIDILQSEKVLFINELESLRFEVEDGKRHVKRLHTENQELMKSASPQTAVSAEQEFTNTIMEGIFVRKYDKKGNYTFQRLVVNFNKGYMDLGEAGVHKLAKLYDVKLGVHTATFHKAHEKDTLVDSVNTCMSVIFPFKTIDIQTADKAQAKRLYGAFRQYMNQLQSH